MKISARIYLLLIYSFFYLPIAVLIVYSFNNSEYSMLWHGFTWHWYSQLLLDSDLITAAWHSIILGISAASIAVMLGTLAAITLYQYRFFGQEILYLTIFMLILLPDIVIGTALLILFSLLHFNLGFISLLLAHITFCMPFAVVIVYSRLSTYDKNIFEAAKDLGASPLTILKKITLPLLMPGLIAAWLLSFTLSLDDVMISYFVAGPSFQILPLQIFSMVKLGVNPEVNALTSVILLATLILVLSANFALRKKL